MKRFHALPKFGPERCPVYLHLPWLGFVSTWFKKHAKPAFKQWFSVVEPRVVYSTKDLLSAINKDILPVLQKINVIYQFVCPCDSRYVYHTFQRLQHRIRQHVPKFIRSCFFSQEHILPARHCKSSTHRNTQSLASDSAVGLHLLQILPVLNIMTTVDSPFLFKALSFPPICSWSHFHQPFYFRPLKTKKNSCIV